MWLGLVPSTPYKPRAWSGVIPEDCQKNIQTPVKSVCNNWSSKDFKLPKEKDDQINSERER